MTQGGGTGGGSRGGAGGAGDGGGGSRPAWAGPACELCEAARLTTWYHEDEVCWVADCEICDVPMVVWRHHGSEPPPAEVEHMLEHLTAAATARFGPDGFSLDRTMRQIPDHFHAHARDPGWWGRRFRTGIPGSGPGRR